MSSKDASVAAIVGPPEKAPPWWILPLVTFLAGFAIPMAMLMTVNATPDYQRGHADGFNMGHKSAIEQLTIAEEKVFAAGVREGRKLEREGR